MTFVGRDGHHNLFCGSSRTDHLAVEMQSVSVDGHDDQETSDCDVANEIASERASMKVVVFHGRDRLSGACQNPLWETYLWTSIVDDCVYVYASSPSFHL